jgi:predicted nucleotidyltransferase component of viral defense system
MQEPIEVRLKTSRQVAMARLQDSIVEAMLEADTDIVMHGGTAIWRCYGGNRFSDDIDIYATESQVRKINNNLTWSLSKRGAQMDYPVYTNRVITISDSFATTKLEAMVPQKGIKTAQKEYERVNGSKLVVTTLQISDFIMEKINTYQKRQYIRDLYDIYYLVSLAPLAPKSKTELKKLLKNMQRPADESKLNDLIYSGVAPSFETMLNYMAGRLK